MRRLAVIAPMVVATGLFIQAGTARAQAVDEAPPFGLTNTPAVLVGYDEAMRQLAARNAASSQMLAQFGSKDGAASGVALNGMASPPNEAPPKEIVELARALRNDPDLFFEYVHNNIVTLPMYGSLKGPVGALLDGSGTSFDQAELLCELLKAAGKTPSFRFGQIQLSGTQISNWLGTDSSSSSVRRIMAHGGLSGAVSPDTGTITNATISWAWVSVEIDGVEYAFDPATKTYERPSLPTGLATVLHYNRDTLLAAARSGASIKSTTVSGINRTNLHDNLATLANNLKTFLAKDGALLNTDALIGGRTIRRLPPNTRLRQTSLPYAAGTPSAEATMPAMFRTLLYVSLPVVAEAGATAPITKLFSSDVYGRSLTIFFDTSLRPALRLDGAIPAGDVGTVAAHALGSQVRIGVAVLHPYQSVGGKDCTLPIWTPGNNPEPLGRAIFKNTSAADQCGTLTVQAGSPDSPGKFALLPGFGGTGRGVIEKRRRMLDEAAIGNDPASVAVLGESLSMQGYDWLAQLTRLAEMSDGLFGTVTVLQHAVGIVGIRAVGSSVGPYVDLPMVMGGFTQRTDDPGLGSASTLRETSALFGLAGWLSALESAVIEQTQPTHTAVSTVSILDRVMTTDVIYDINNLNVSGSTASSYTKNIRPELKKTYANADLAKIDRLVNEGRRVIAPRKGAVSVDQWKGVGYYSIGQGSEQSISALITGGMSGGFVTKPIPIPTFTFNSRFTFEPDAMSFIYTGLGVSPGGNAAGLPKGGDPVNLPTGHYLYENTDLKTGGGEFPYALAFTRSYDSGLRLRKGSLGYGWSHSFEARAQRDSDGFEALGLNSPTSGAAAIVAVYVVQDLMNSVSAKPLDLILITAAIQQWAMDQMTDNVVTVTQPGNSEHFVRLPDGTYNPPLGSASSLSPNPVGGYTYKAKDQTTLTFDADGKLTAYSPSTGPAISFTYNGSSQLATVANTLGRKLTLSYSGDLVSAVSDDAGRSIGFTYDGSGNLSTASDTSGKLTNYTYAKLGQLRQIFYPSHPTIPYITNTFDSLDRVATQVDALEHRTDSFFAGSRTEIVNPAGQSRVYYFTPRGKTLLDTDEAGQTTSTEYDTLDRVVRTTLPAGDSIFYAYDDRHNVLSITHRPPPGSPAPPSVKTFTYDALTNKVRSETDENGRTTTMTYDANGNLQSRVDPLGNVEKMAYNAVGLLTSATDALDRTISRAYDAAGNLTLVTDALQRSTRYTYDAAGRRLTMTDGRGNTWRYTYDARGNVASTTDPLNNVVTNVYDAGNRLVSVTNPRGFTRTLGYDASGLLVREVDEKGNAIVHEYDGLSRRIRTTDARGNQTTFGYDANGRLARVTDANGNVSQTVFDENGQTVKTVDAKGGETQFTNDFLGRPTAIRDPMGHTVTKTYDGLGLVTRDVDEFGRATSYGYDAAGRVTRITDSAGSTLDLTHDAAGNRISQRDRKGHLWTGTYDALNRLQSTTNPLGHPVSWAWDEAGNRVGRTDALGRTVTYVYDAANRLVGVNYPDGSTVVFTLDANGNVTRMVDALGTSTYVYDELDRVTSYTDPFGKQIRYGYDANGNRTSLTYPDGKVVTYQYDAGNRMTSVTDWRGRVITLGHDDNDLLTAVDFPNGTKTRQTFDGANRLRGRTDTPSISAYTLTQDSANDRLSVTAQQPLEATPGAGATNVVVDAADRLVSVGNVQYTFDANGNNTRRGTGTGQTVFAYDFENRLVANGSVRYGYDGLGVRLQTIGGGTTTRFVVDASNDLTQVLCETDGSGSITRYYIYGPGLLAAVMANDDAFYYHFDPSGSTIAITNGTGRVVNKYAYDPFGAILNSSEEIANPFAFSGQYGLMKEPNGLVYARARFYEPATGRFLTSDPLRNGIDGLLDTSQYVYADGDPITAGDPSGLVKIDLGVFNIWARFEEWHASRQDQNNPMGITLEKDAKRLGRLAGAAESVFHGDGNRKYVLPDGSELVFDRNGTLVTDPRYMGTFNRGRTKVGHLVLDVLPYLILGNLHGDPSTLGERLALVGKSAVIKVGQIAQSVENDFRAVGDGGARIGRSMLPATASRGAQPSFQTWLK